MDTKRITVIFFIFLVLPIIIILKTESFFIVSGRDTGVYAYIGDMVLKGEIPYRDIWDHKTPLIYYLNALIFRLFGSQFKTISIFEVLWLFVSCIFIYKLSNLMFRQNVSLFVSLIFSIYISSSEIIGGYGMVETFAVLPAIIAIFCIIKYKMTSKRPFLFIGGLMVSTAFLFKQTAIVVMLPIMLYLAIYILCQKQKFSQLLLEYLIFILGVLVPLAAFFIYFFVKGALGDCISQIFIYNFIYSKGISVYFLQSVKKLIYVTFVTCLGRWPFLVGFGITGILYKLFDFSREIKNRVPKIRLQEYSLFFMLFSWFLLNLYCVAYSGRFYINYYTGAIPCLALLSGYTMEYLGKQFKSSLRFLSFVVVLLLFSSPFFQGTYSALAFVKNKKVILNNTNSVEIDGFRYRYQRPFLLRWIMSNTSKDDFIYFWGAEAGLNFLTKRKNPTKYAYLYPLQKPGYVNGYGIRRFIKDLRENKPKFIIDTSSTNRRIASLNLSGLKPKQCFYYYDWKLLLPAIEFINDNYIYETTIEGWDIYRRK